MAPVHRASDLCSPGLRRGSSPTFVATTVTLVVVVVLANLGSAAVLGAQQLPLGPFHVSEQNPLYRLQHTPQPDAVDVVREGRLRTSFLTAYSNIFEQSSSDRHVQLFDLEQMTTVLGARYGLGRRVEVGGELSLHTGWGGFLDGFVSGFHQALGLPNGGRQEEPSGQHLIRLDGEDPAVRLVIPRRTLDIEGGSIFAKWQALGTRESGYAVSLRGTLRAAAGPIDPGRIDGALSVLGRASGRGEYEGVHLYGGAGIVSLDAPRALDPLFADMAGYFLFGSERRISPGVSGIFQLQAGTPYVEVYDVGELDRFPMSLSLGLAGETEGGWAWHAAFTEDFPPESPSVDFTLTFGLSRGFAP